MLQFREANKINLFVLIGLFILLDSSMLGLNILLTRQLEQDAVEINVAGWQRMLSQAISKNIYALDRAIDQGRKDEVQHVKVSVERDMQSYRHTLNAFKYGGVTVNPKQEEVYLRRVVGNDKLNVIGAAESAWVDLHDAIEDYFSRSMGSLDDLSILINQVQINNIVMLDNMNQLVWLLEKQSIRKAESIRLFQFLAFFLAFANFVYILRNYSSIIQLKDKNLATLNQVIHSIDAAVVLINIKKDKVVSFNKAAEKIFSSTSSEYIGSELKRLISLGPSDDGKYSYCGKSGNVHLDFVRRSTVSDGGGFEVITINDVSSHIECEQFLSTLAYVDPLTKISNRLVIDDRLVQELKRSKRKKYQMSLLYIDLDGFKSVNDALGHDYGDQLLIEVSKVIQGSCRECDTVGRVGGDEFIVICPETHCAAAVKLGKKITDKICEIHLIGGEAIHIGASIGVATYPNNGESIEELKRYADQAMYKIKQSNHSRRRIKKARFAVLRERSLF